VKTSRVIVSDLMLLLAAVIWGSTFVAQKVGMEHIGPLTYNAIRFAVAVVVLLPFGFVFKRLNPEAGKFRQHLLPGILTGLVLFAAATLQQWGMVWTTAGSAGFITGLYVVLVPLAALVWKKRVLWNQILGALLALSGLYLLSVKGGFVIGPGDLLVCISALFWTGHILCTDHFSRRLNAVWFVQIQNLVTALLSLAGALLFEVFDLRGIRAAAGPFLYSGCLSVGLAFVLQAAAQRHAPPAHASILMSLEGLFAALGGRLILGERLLPLQILGCCLMLAGMLSSQLKRDTATRPPLVNGQTL
jgi:drug/metabolite transporter (DMT)-like permease